MVDAPGSSKALGWLSLVLLALAALAFVVPTVFFAIASGDEGVALGDGPTEVRAPADRSWGIYFDDADNSGYSSSCTATDSSGRPIDIRGPGWTVTSSETEMLDHVFTTPEDGLFTVDCDAFSADVRVGPVGSIVSVLLGIAGAALLGLGSVVSGVLWLTRRTSTSLLPVPV